MATCGRDPGSIGASPSGGERASDVLTPVTWRALGDVAVTFFADQRIDTFDADVTSGNAELDRTRFYCYVDPSGAPQVREARAEDPGRR